jgi:transposase
MKLHANAALSLKGRRELCRRVISGQRTVTEATEAAEVSARCARKWVGRYRAEGELGLRDRSSAPRSIPHRTGQQRVAVIAALRRLRFTGPEIAETLGMAVSTVSGILTQIGWAGWAGSGWSPPSAMSVTIPASWSTSTSRSRVGSLTAPGTVTPAAGTTSPIAPTEKANAAAPGGGSTFHIAIDDCTCLAYAEVLADETAPTAVGFLRRAIQFYARHGVTVRAVLSAA